MKEKKQSQEWNIAATHYLTAGFAIPFLITFLFGLVVSLILPSAGNSVFVNITGYFVGLISLWLGTIYSSNYVMKTYIIKNNNNITKLSTIYMFILNVLYYFYNLYKLHTLSVITFIYYIISVLVFYFASKRYLKNNISEVEL